METKNYFQLTAVAAVACMVAFASCGSKDNAGTSNEDDNTTDPWGDDDTTSFVVNVDTASLKGSNYYVLMMDDVSRAKIADREVAYIGPDGADYPAPTNITTRQIDIWEGTYAAGSTQGPNAYGEITGWFAMVVTSGSWNGGGFFANPAKGDSLFNADNATYADKKAPDFSQISENRDEYYFHVAIKSPSNQPDAGVTLTFYDEKNQDGSKVGQYSVYLGPSTNKGDAVWSKDYPHDGSWHSFDIPIAELKKSDGTKWTWTKSMQPKDYYFLTFINAPSIEGHELNLDGMFFYKK
ncbi:MAG: hypothetical protein LBH84_07870 [Prevotellaceae bacterium]|jgi:hypothetical protein|nr:hypothetical protein [Prevotellaceae bacterium]